MNIHLVNQKLNATIEVLKNSIDKSTNKNEYQYEQQVNEHHAKGLIEITNGGGDLFDKSDIEHHKNFFDESRRRKTRFKNLFEIKVAHSRRRW